jgi:hypothetical protein
MNYADIIDDLGEFSEIFKDKQYVRMIQDCLRDLSQKTYAYTTRVPVLTTAGESDYTLTPLISNTQVFGIQEAWKAVIHTPQPTTSTAATGGTLAAATYSYRVTAIKNDYGETLPCTAVTQATTGTTSTVTLTWTAISGASGYRIYGRTDANWLLMKEVAAGTLTWTDDGSLTPSGTMPTTSELMEMIEVTNDTTMNDRNYRWRLSESNDARRISYDGYSTIRLSDIPTTSGIGYLITAAIYPTTGSRTATIPPIYEHYQDAIKDYVRWQAYAYPQTAKNPWADTQKAMIYRKQYVRARANLKSNVFRGFGGELTADPNYFATGLERSSSGGYANI